MIPAMDLALTVDFAKRLPDFMGCWGHPDIAEETLARAVDLTKKHNDDPANASNQWELPAKVLNGRGLPGFTVFRMDSPAQEDGLKNRWQLDLGEVVYTDIENKTALAVSQMPIKCIYEIALVCRNTLDRATFERMMWFSWANQPLDVKFQDAAGNTFTHTCPKFLDGNPQYSFETIDTTASQLLYKVNWRVRLDGHWFKSQVHPIVTTIQNTYEEFQDGNPVILTPFEQQVLTRADYPDDYDPALDTSN